MIDVNLLQGWNKHLQECLHESDKADVTLDEHDPSLLRIHIITEGRSGYTFDFTAQYVDDREIKVVFVDVERVNQTVDEHTDQIQSLTEDYVRHIHECAQIMQRVTHA
ncbi:MAG: hypothetical protein K6T85_16090 [Gorillibacterium sp.]|nr:hypothetical protein [Gorillibacterium sp.]